MIEDKKSISVIIPAKNEEKNILGSINASIYAAGKNFNDYEIIVVDDGSTDNTLKIAQKNVKSNKKIRVICHPKSYGFGYSFNTGRKNAKKKFAVMVHGDDVFERENLSYFFSHAGQADMILGFIDNPESRSKTRQMISAVYTKLLNFLFRLNLKYYNGIQIHKTDWIKNLNLYSDGFGFMAEIVLKAIMEGRSYIEVPYKHRERPGGGVTKIFKIKNIKSVIQTIFYLCIWSIRNPYRHLNNNFTQVGVGQRQIKNTKTRTRKT